MSSGAAGSFHRAQKMKDMLMRTQLERSNLPIVRQKNCIYSLAVLFFLLLSGSVVQAQTSTIRGIVSDSLGAPLPGVSVAVKNSRTGTSTNTSGEFVLNGVPARAVLVISYVGLETQEIALAAGQTTLNVTLRADITALQDVVVTGFQRIEKKKFTGAAVTLRAEDVKIDGVADVSRMLEGRAAGVSIQNVSSTFGSAPKVRVRGATSINGDNKPLWVVDGVVLDDIINISNDQLSSGDPVTLLGSSVAGISANDIESFDILKDAAATALYGARAMNGVVVITTKKGRAGRQSISYTGNFSSQFKPTYADYNISNSAQQMSILAELERKGWLTSSILDEGNYGVYGKYYDLLNANANGQFGIPNTPEAKKAFLMRYATANTDWFDVLFRQSVIQEHSLSVATGNEKTQSFFSTSFYNDNGWTVADNVKRYTLNFRNNYNFSDRLSTGFITTGSYRQQEAPGTISRVPNPVEGSFRRDFDINPFSYALNTSRTLTAYDTLGNREYFTRNFAPFNILTELENNRLKINVIDLKLQGELGYKLTNDLRFDFIGAIRYVRSTREHEITENANMANAYRAASTATMRQNNPYLYQDPENPSAEKVVVLPYGGFYNRVEDQLLSYDVRNSLNYVKTFNEKHNVNLLIGQQVKFSDRQNSSNTGYGYQYDNGGVPATDYRIIKQAIENNFPYFGMSKDFDRFAAFYFNGQYTYQSKYNFYGTVRYDGSNQLGSSRTARWLPTWSFGGSWNIDQESFFQDLESVDLLKLRASYGLTASLGPATNSSIILRNLNVHRPYTDDVETLIRIANLENSELTWEKNYTLNVGVDAGFFGNRLSTSIDVYQRKSFDLISIIKTSGIGGEAFKAANYADMKSHGAEVLLSGHIIRSKDLNWRSNVTFGYNTTEITNIENLPQIFDLVKAEGGNKKGYPVNGLFSIRFTGLNPTTGVPLFIDEKGDTTSSVFIQDDSTQHLKFEGSVNPKITGGFNNTITYKNFSLNIFITYQAGNKIRLYPAFKTSYAELDATPKEFYDRWVLLGDQNKTNIPSIMDAYQSYLNGNGFPYNNYNFSTERVAKGDFIRLKSVSLTYQLPESLVSKTGFVKTLAVTAAAINPWLIYADKKLEGQDPEFFNAGGVAQPIQKQFTISLKAGF
jgi:TonB-linked SusC/RagA family outer membrane protein